MKITLKTKRALATAKAAHANAKTAVKSAVKTAQKTAVKAIKAIAGVTLTCLQNKHNNVITLDFAGESVQYDSAAKRLIGKIQCDGRTQLGAYVNGSKYGKGRTSDVNVELLDFKGVNTLLKACTFEHNEGKGEHKGLCLGDTAKAECLGMISFETKKRGLFVWHVEQDSNNLNKFERAGAKLVKEDGEHKALRKALADRVKGNVRIAKLTGSRGTVLRLVRVDGTTQAK